MKVETLEELRDYFAGQAIIGLLMSEDHFQTEPEQYARESYKIADAMIKEKEKTDDRKSN